MSDTNRSATAKEIQKWSEENDEPHPVFEVPNRPERKNLSDEKRLKALADEIRSWADQHGSDLSAMSETEKVRVASYHRCAEEIERLVNTGTGQAENTDTSDTEDGK